MKIFRQRVKYLDQMGPARKFCIPSSDWFRLGSNGIISFVTQPDKPVLPWAPLLQLSMDTINSIVLTTDPNLGPLLTVTLSNTDICEFYMGDPPVWGQTELPLLPSAASCPDIYNNAYYYTMAIGQDWATDVDVDQFDYPLEDGVPILLNWGPLSSPIPPCPAEPEIDQYVAHFMLAGQTYSFDVPVDTEMSARSMAFVDVIVQCTGGTDLFRQIEVPLPEGQPLVGPSHMPGFEKLEMKTTLIVPYGALEGEPAGEGAETYSVELFIPPMIWQHQVRPTDELTVTVSISVRDMPANDSSDELPALTMNWQRLLLPEFEYAPLSSVLKVHYISSKRKNHIPIWIPANPN